MSFKCNTPILLLTFNRLETTKKVIAAISKVQPNQMFIVSDGPRKNIKNEKQRVEQVRQYLTENIDWPCTKKFLFRDQNLGCRFSPAQGIDWFFSHVNEGIILEDDCIPSVDFFRFAEWGLKKYRDEQSVWHINGNNFAADKSLYSGKISFTALPQVWGWATWKNRWSKYQGNPFYLEVEARENYKKWDLPWICKQNIFLNLQRLKEGLDAWDYQWQITMLNSSGLALSCSSNLITNIGHGEDASHTVKKDNRINLPATPIEEVLSFKRPEENKLLTKWYTKKMNLRSYKSFLKKQAYSYKKSSLKKLREVIQAILFSKTKKIIIASTGRSGSTLLYDSIVNGYIKKEFHISSNNPIFPLLRKLCLGILPRFKHLPNNKAPILKTHDLFSNEAITGKEKVLFVYGEPLEAAKSVALHVQKKGRIWFDEHIFNLNSGGIIENLFFQDILNYQKQMKSWGKAKKLDNVFIVKFDDIWAKKQEIETFIGFNIELPEKKERTPKDTLGKYNKRLFDDLDNIFTKF